MANVGAPYPWQSVLWDAVVARLEAGRLPHALLIAGPPGWGQWEFALVLARRILGLESVAAEDPIIHPDFRLMTIEEGKRQILVDQIRGLNQFAFETASAGGAKVAVIAPAEALNVNAANALLKTLEEPPSNTYLLLGSFAAGRLLPTITSRCQRLTLGIGGQERAREWLLAEAGSGANTEAAMFFAGGAPLAALALLEEGTLGDAQTLERCLLDPRGDVGSLLQLANKHSLDELLDWWLRIAVRWESEAPGRLESFEFLDALIGLKAEALAVPLNAPLVVQSLQRRWCDLAHKSVHSN